MKKTFVGYCDRKSYTDEMSDEEAGKLFKTIIKYANNLEIGNIDQLTKVVFSKIKKSMDEDDEKYKEICEKRKKAIQERYKKYDSIQKDTNVYKWIQEYTNVYKASDVNYDTDTDTDTDTDYSSKDYNTEILDLVEKFTSIKENAYNETQATIKKIGRKKYVDNQYNTIEKLIRAGHTLEQIEDVAIFCTKDEFRKWNVKSLCKLDQANKEWVKYINVLLDKIK